MKEPPATLTLAEVLLWLKSATAAEAQAVKLAAANEQVKRFGEVGSHVVAKGTGK